MAKRVAGMWQAKTVINDNDTKYNQMTTENMSNSQALLHHRINFISNAIDARVCLWTYHPYIFTFVNLYIFIYWINILFTIQRDE